MYAKFFTIAGLKFTFLLFLLIGGSYLAYAITNSLILTFFISALIFITLRLCFGGGLNYRKNLVFKLRESFENTDDNLNNRHP